MRTVQVNVYQFSELSDTAKRRAKDEHAGNFGYYMADEALAALKALAEHFGGKLENYNVDFFGGTPSFATFDFPDWESIGNDNVPDHIQRSIGQSDATEADTKAAYADWLKEKVESLGQYNPETSKGLGDYVLTGVCADEDAIDGLRAAYLKGELDLNKLIQSAFKSWISAQVANCESYYSDEQFGETCDANNWEFLVSGESVGDDYKISD